MEAGRAWARLHARMAHLRRLAAEAEVMEREDLNWQDPRVVARVALRNDDAAWEELPGAPDLPDEVALEEGWLDGFIEGALEILDAVEG